VCECVCVWENAYLCVPLHEVLPRCITLSSLSLCVYVHVYMYAYVYVYVYVYVHVLVYVCVCMNLMRACSCV